MIKLIECPRDAMQGIKEFIPTNIKAEYINKLLKVGFDTIDFGSFVSPKAIPQLYDTADVLKKLDLSDTYSKLLAIVVNMKGAETVCMHEEIDCIGFPFSVSETFQQKNTNSSIEQSLIKVEEIHKLSIQYSKELVVYLSMGFGNPYNDQFNFDVVAGWVDKLIESGIEVVSFADTIGVAKVLDINKIIQNLIQEFPFIEFGVHFHTTPYNWKEKLIAAYDSGCRRFDGAILGYGGCPMTDDEMVGNIPTENIVSYFDEINEDLPEFDRDAFNEAQDFAKFVFKK